MTTSHALPILMRAGSTTSDDTTSILREAIAYVQPAPAGRHARDDYKRAVKEYSAVMEKAAEEPVKTEQIASPPTLTVVIPVYNEGPNIAGVLRDVRVHALSSREILVVYDFDADDTVPVVRSLRDEMPEVGLLRNARGGVLHAMRTGIDASRGDFVLITMGDRSDDLTSLPQMLELARAGAAVVAASRYMRGGREHGGPFVKRTLSRLAGALLHLVGGLPIRDPTSAFKLYSGPFIRSCTIESTAGFALALELCVKAHRRGLQLAEIPTVWSDRVAGRSRFQLWRWMPHYLRWFFYGIVGRFR